jgi:hypothetical protein
LQVPHLVKALGQFADVRLITSDAARPFLTCEADLPDDIEVMGEQEVDASDIVRSASFDTLGFLIALIDTIGLIVAAIDCS